MVQEENQEQIASKKPEQEHRKSKIESKTNPLRKWGEILPWDFLVTSLAILIVVFITRNSIPGSGAATIIPGGNTISQPLGTIWFSNPMQKISKTQASVNERAKISAARNEYESFQIVISPKNMLFLSPQTYNVTISDFNGPETISSSNVEIYREEYVDTGWNIDWNTHTRIYTGKKLMPDPLVKITPDKWSNLSKTDNQPIWFTVYVPEGTPAGTYFATVEITLSSGTKFTKAVQLDVYNFSLPHDFALQSLFGLREVKYHFQEGAYPQTHEEIDEYNSLVRDYYKEFGKNRLNPFLYNETFSPLCSHYAVHIKWDTYPPPTPPHKHYSPYCIGWFNKSTIYYYQSEPWSKIYNLQYDLFKPLADEFLKPGGPITFNTFTVKNNTGDIQISYNINLEQLETKLIEEEIIDKAVYYLWDEACPDDIEDYLNDYGEMSSGIKSLAQPIKELAPHIDIAISIPSKCGDLSATEILNQMFAINDEEQLIDIWVLHMKLVSPETLPLIEERQAMGEKTWLYSQTDGLTTITHFQQGIKGNEGIANRLLPWYAWKYDVGGLLYYSVNELCSNRWKYPSDVCPGVDIYQGSGALFYPACKNQDDTVNCKTQDSLDIVPTIRWELLREGMEDYEYFKLLHDKNIPEGEVLLTNTMNLLGDHYYQFDTSANKYYLHRNAIAKMIENN